MTTGLQLEILSTGQPELDAILGGGIPARSVTVIAGEPGSGKTILTLQMLFHAARRGQKCLYFTTLSEPAVKVIRYMQAFDFFDVDLLDDRIVFVDLGRFIRQGAEATLAEIVARVEAHEPDFIAIDSFRSIGELHRASGDARAFVYDLATELAVGGATTLFVGEYVREEFPSFAEFAVADGIVRLGSERQELTCVREIEVLKLRGANYVSGRHFFEIGTSGLMAFPRVRAPETHAPDIRYGEREPTGVAGLDQLLDGGIPCGSATVIQGGTGTGKTALCLHFLMEGVRRGQKGLLCSLEETPDQLRWVAKGFGWDLAAHEAAGQLDIHYSSPVELSTDRFLHGLRRRVEELGAQRVAIDSLTTMALGVPSERRFKELTYAAAKHLRNLGCTVVMSMEADQLLGAAHLSGLGVSFVADNLVQLRYVEMDGRLGRALSVIKSRGVNVDTSLRLFTIGASGVVVSPEGLGDLRGILTGLPTR